MRRRDLHMVVAECVLTCCALASCALAVCVARYAKSRTAAELSDMRERVERAERMVADASAAAIAACELVRDAPDSATSDGDGDPRPTRIRGYGQGRTPRSHYVYRDVELSDGSCNREYIAWLPISPSDSE